MKGRRPKGSINLVGVECTEYEDGREGMVGLVEGGGEAERGERARGLRGFGWFLTEPKTGKVIVLCS